MANKLKILFIIIILLFPSIGFGLTALDQTDFGNNVYEAVSASETYQLTENVTCEGSCFIVGADNVTLDLNDKTMTFGTANNSGITDPDFEAWNDANTPTNWTVVAGTATRVDSLEWGTYCAQLAASTTIKSSTTTVLNAGKTYVYFAFLKGVSGAAYTIYLKDNSDDSTLASTLVSGDNAEKGYAMDSGAIGATEHEFKPGSQVTVYIQIELNNVGSAYLAWSDVKPAKDFGIVDEAYYKSTVTPDISGASWQSSTGFTVKDGTINQGAGYAVKAAAIWSGTGCTGWTVENVNVNMKGTNTAAFVSAYSGGHTIDDLVSDTESDAAFNRKRVLSGVKFGATYANTTNIVRNSTIQNDPEIGIGFYGCWHTGDTTTYLIENNTVTNNERVTEGYSVVLNGTINAIVSGNILTPIEGRGILLDSVGCSGVDYDGNKDFLIKDNTITAYETRNLEYSESGLHVVGIRIRNFSGAGQEQIGRVTGNTITVSTDANGVHAAGGILIAPSAAGDDIEIDNNTIIVTQTDQEWATGIGASWGNNSGARQSIHNNVIIATDFGIGFDYGDGWINYNLSIYLNDITAGVAPIRFGMDIYNKVNDNIDIYCNKLNNTGAAGYPFYLNADLTDIQISNNEITNSNGSGYEVWVDADESSDVIFCENGTIDVTGGGSVGSDSDPCQDGSSACYENAGLAITIRGMKISKRDQ